MELNNGVREAGVGHLPPSVNGSFGAAELSVRPRRFDLDRGDAWLGILGLSTACVA